MVQALSNRQNCTCIFKHNIYKTDMSLMVSYPELCLPLHHTRLDKAPVHRCVCTSSCKLSCGCTRANVYMYVRIPAIERSHTLLISYFSNY